MCKLFILSGPIRRASVNQVLEAANTAFLFTEKDGFGFIARGRTGYARGRYLDPSKFAGFGSGLPDWLVGPFCEENKIPVLSHAVIVHGRTSTNKVALGNVHPFVRGGCALAHNGIVNWIGKGKQPKHSCDSEQFFSWLEHHHDWHQARTHFAGTGAVAHLDLRSGQMVVARDGIGLYIAKRVHGGWAMATREEHLVSICRAAKVQLASKPLLIPNMRLLRFNAIGEVDACENWQGFGVTRSLFEHASTISTPYSSSYSSSERFADYNGPSGTGGLDDTRNDRIIRQDNRRATIES